MDKQNSIPPPEFDYLRKLIGYRMCSAIYSSRGQDIPDEFIHLEYDRLPSLPALNTWHLPWQDFVENAGREFKDEELTLLLIGVVPHLKPDLFDQVIETILNKEGQYTVDFPRIGGVRGKNCRFFLPTGETGLFLGAGDEYKKRLQVQQYFGAEHYFWQKKVLWLEDMQNGEPSMHGRLILSSDYVDLLTYGRHTSPQFSISFPARKIAPEWENGIPDEGANVKSRYASFENLVIPDRLIAEIGNLKNWLQYHKQLKKMFDHLPDGYRTLFCGPPGTGKTFTAKILGNELKKEVYRIDLSMVVSKYIGETEKNLELLFTRAEDKEWILFFDEADAIFGKRTNVRDAHDKYANQEVSYLLQRIEDYNGLVILATNKKNNIDEAFMRRFNSVLDFPFPDTTARAKIWEIFFPKKEKNIKKLIYRRIPGANDEVDIPEEVKNYELSGGSIMNVVHYSGIKAMERYNHELKKNQQPLITYSMEVTSFEETVDIEEDPCNLKPEFIIYLLDVKEGIKRELTKEGKPFAP